MRYIRKYRDENKDMRAPDSPFMTSFHIAFRNSSETITEMPDRDTRTRVAPRYRHAPSPHRVSPRFDYVCAVLGEFLTTHCGTSVENTIAHTWRTRRDTTAETCRVPS